MQRSYAIAHHASPVCSLVQPQSGVQGIASRLQLPTSFMTILDQLGTGIWHDPQLVTHLVRLLHPMLAWAVPRLGSTDAEEAAAARDCKAQVSKGVLWTLNIWCQGVWQSQQRGVSGVSGCVHVSQLSHAWTCQDLPACS